MATPETPAALVVSLYEYHSKLFRNALDGISDKDAQNRLGTKANHVAWIAGSLIYQRQVLANAIGLSVTQRAEGLFKAENGQGFKGIQDDVQYPALAEYLQDWDTISSALQQGLTQMSDAEWQGPDPFAMPEGQYTFMDSFTFCVDRESYCIGQIGLYRRLLGYEAMKWE